MKTNIVMTTGLVLLAACGSAPASGNQAQAKAGPGTAARQLDIAGIRPGMKATDAVATLKQSGWKIEAHKGDNWTETVERAADRRLGRMTPIFKAQTGIESYGAIKGEESVSFAVVPSADGGRVGQISYRAPDAGRSQDQVRAEVMRRYGAPTSDPRQRFKIAPRGSQGPTLTLDMDSSGVLLMLVPGATADREAQAAIDRAVNAKVGTLGASF